MTPLRQLACVLALVGAVAPATVLTAAAQKTFPDTGNSPEGALPGPNATPPGAEAHSANAEQSTQPVPGTWPGSSTVPSTMSEKNAADDKLIIVAYTFKNLTPEEKTAIVEGVRSASGAQRVTADMGTELPLSVTLRPLPDAVVAKVPRTKGYAYLVTDNKVMLVQAPTRFVVAVLDVPAPTTTGAGAPLR